MAHFAKIESGVVTQVLVAEPEFIASGIVGAPDSWVQTSYNTRGGVHYDPATGIPSVDQTKALRKNYAGVGYAYDPVRDAFIPPRPFASWVLDEQTCWWAAPSPTPDDGGSYLWDEGAQQWRQISSPNLP